MLQEGIHTYAFEHCDQEQSWVALWETEWSTLKEQANIVDQQLKSSEDGLKLNEMVFEVAADEDYDYVDDDNLPD